MALIDLTLGQLKKRIAKAISLPAFAIVLAAGPAAANCLDFNASASAISTDCERQAGSPSLKGFETGIAAYNAARAFINSAGSAVSPSDQYARAIGLIDQSYARLTDEALMSESRETLGFSSSDWRKWQKLPRAAFRFDRMMLSAMAYKNIGLAQPFMSTSVCGSRIDCLTRAITRLQSDSSALAFAPAGASQGDARYNEFYFQRGSLFSARNEAADADRAMDDFRRVRLSPRQERKVDATTALEQMALRLAGENLARGGTSLIQAIRYYNVALEVRPNSGAASSGLGKAYLSLCRDPLSTPGQRLPNCLSAGQSFRAALTAPDANLLEANLGLGEAMALAATEQLKINPNDSGIARYRQESSDAYARAATAGGGNAKAKLELAKALQGAQPDRAIEAYRDYVGFELSYPDWFASGFGSGVGSQFQQKLAAIGGSETRRNIGESILAIYKLRAAMGGMRKDVGVSLLNAALQAQPVAADASNELGKLHLLPPVDAQAARAAFNGVINSTGGPNGPPALGREKMRAEAFYQLSQIEAETVGSTTRAATTPAGLKYARDAFALDSADPRFKKAACIAYIVTFRYSAADTGSSSWCAGIGGADGQLLLGMYNLRVAQTAPAAQKSRFRDEARFAFNQGKGLVPRAADGTPVKFESEWRNAPAPMSVASLLEFGIAKADACDRINVRLSLPQDEVTRASSQFDFFQVGSCNG